MIVTTAGKTTIELIHRAKRIAKALELSYVERMAESIVDLHKQYQADVLVVGKNRLQLFKQGTKAAFFFHPNSAMFRVKRLINGDTDPLIEATQLEAGSTFLDCTLGLSSDSIVASYQVGTHGKVVGLEMEKVIAYMVGEGVKTWESGLQVFDEAMRRIKVVQANHYDFLKSQPEGSFDIVYFDPMFEQQITDSNGINELRELANYSDLNKAIIDEAKRVAIKRIVLKDHFRSSRFNTYGFNVIKRPSAKFHFGVLEI
jgi:hypothetical protein